jgi:hypothetical protein
MAHPGYTKAEKSRQFLFEWWMREKCAPELLDPELHGRVGELLRDDPDAEDEVAYLALYKQVRGGVRDRIPPERRTIPMTLKKAAECLGYTDHHGEKNAVEMLSKSIRDGSFRAEKLNRQRYVFDRSDFPEEAQQEIKLKQRY